MIRLIYILCYVGIISLMAQVTIDLNLPNVSIPVSGQTLAILTGAVFLKPIESALAIALYCLLGIIGIPIFSDGNAGWEAFSGGSLGYFIGFLFAAMGTSYLSMIGWVESIAKLSALQILGTLIILSMGTVFLCFKFGIAKGIEYGFTPFVIGGIVKIILGVIIVHLIQRFKLLPATNNAGL